MIPKTLLSEAEMIRHGLKHVAKKVGLFYAANPHKIVHHGITAVQIGSLAWMHSQKAAKHSVKFMAKAASKGFTLFRS
jgi:hypothetical protein